MKSDSFVCGGRQDAIGQMRGLLEVVAKHGTGLCRLITSYNSVDGYGLHGYKMWLILNMLSRGLMGFYKCPFY